MLSSGPEGKRQQVILAQFLRRKNLGQVETDDKKAHWAFKDSLWDKSTVAHKELFRLISSLLGNDLLKTLINLS